MRSNLAKISRIWFLFSDSKWKYSPSVAAIEATTKTGYVVDSLLI